MEKVSSETVSAALRFQWKWVMRGVLVGALVMGVIVGVTARGFQNIFIPSLIACTGFVVTGIIVGYYSRGVTILEAAVGGAILAVFLLGSLLTFFDHRMGFMQTATTLAFGYLLSLLGAWVGESLQEDRAEQLHGMQWRWVFIGSVVALVLNSLGVFGLAGAMSYNLNSIFISFLVTFVVAGYIVGYFSHGVTIKEAALAGLMTIIVDWIIVEVGLEIPVPLASMLFAMMAGFLLAMMGAWMGERLQASRQQKNTA